MAESDRHTMLLVNRDSAGVEEWYCPICARRFTMTWPPEFHRTILEPGDENAIHVGGKGDMGMEFSSLGGRTVTFNKGAPTLYDVAADYYWGKGENESRPWFDNEWEGKPDV